MVNSKSSNCEIKYNFDELIERHGTDAYKYTYLKDVAGRDDVLAMWVADMDFATPPFVLDVVRKRAEQRILGYTCSTDTYRQAIVDWDREHYGWQIEPDWINYVPGVVAGIYLAMQTFTEKGDRILIQDPVYHPFRIVPEGSGREIVWNRLRRTSDSFEMDLEALRRDIRGCRMMILCNPHNPAGICWSSETLREVAHICHEEGVLVVSDEIHCDMLLGGRRHIPFATVSEEAAENCITLAAPSKTFNMPGIVCSQAIVPNPDLRQRYFTYIEQSDMDLGNVFCYDCATACYSAEGDNWRRQMLAYVERNIDRLTELLAPVSTLIRVIRPEASFLVLLDCRELMEKLEAESTKPKAQSTKLEAQSTKPKAQSTKLEAQSTKLEAQSTKSEAQSTKSEAQSDSPLTGDPRQEALVRFLADRCGVGFNPGNMFGSGALGYMRMNVGCPLSTVEQAARQMVEGISKLSFSHGV